MSRDEIKARNKQGQQTKHPMCEFQGGSISRIILGKV